VTALRRENKEQKKKINSLVKFHNALVMCSVRNVLYKIHRTLGDYEERNKNYWNEYEKKGKFYDCLRTHLGRVVSKDELDEIIRMAHDILNKPVHEVILNEHELLEEMFYSDDRLKPFIAAAFESLGVKLSWV
jgi:hypothetical protein